VGIFETFSKRLAKSLRGKEKEIFQYDVIPSALRVQTVQIFSDIFGGWDGYPDSSGFPNRVWIHAKNTLCRELGVFELNTFAQQNPYLECANYLLQEEGTKHFLDLVDILAIQATQDAVSSNWYQQRYGRPLSSTSGLHELNYRFREHLVGYAFEGGRLVRVDSQILHAEVTKPALELLSEPKFQGPSDEFMKAHQHYCKKAYKESMTDSLKAFESTMKTICAIRKWTVDPQSYCKGLTGCDVLQGPHANIPNHALLIVAQLTGIWSSNCTQSTLGTWAGSGTSGCPRLHGVVHASHHRKLHRTAHQSA
jgi:hypothetical protein